MNDVCKLKQHFPSLTLEIYKQFLNTHYTDLILNPDFDVVDEFESWCYFNHVEI